MKEWYIHNGKMEVSQCPPLYLACFQVLQNVGKPDDSEAALPAPHHSRGGTQEGWKLCTESWLHWFLMPCPPPWGMTVPSQILIAWGAHLPSRLHQWKEEILFPLRDQNESWILVMFWGEDTLFLWWLLGRKKNTEGLREVTLPQLPSWCNPGS